MKKILKRHDKKCCICGKPVLSVHSMYCSTHARLAFRMKIRRFPPEAVEGVWNYIRANGDRCFYTKMLLEMDDIRSPWFCVFDHLIPLDPRKIVLTSALVNEIKTALSVREFWYYVQQLADFIDKGKKIKKTRLAYWRRHLPQSRAKSLPEKKPIWPHPKDKKCDICGRPVFNIRSKYCLRCSRFNHRMELKGFSPQVVEEIREHLRTKGYVCFHTGLALDMDNDRSPWYGVFDYLTPGDPSKVVLTCALFNEMKSDLSIREFWYYIRQLANYKRKHTKIRKKKLVYWYRLTPKELYVKSLRD
jgi:hypothetical protein